MNALSPLFYIMLIVENGAILKVRTTTAAAIPTTAKAAKPLFIINF
jgi:hypothetical protein